MLYNIVLVIAKHQHELAIGIAMPYQNQIDYILCSQRRKSSLQSAETRPGADCGLDHELLIAKFRLKLKKVGKTTRPLRYDLNVVLISSKYISIKKKKRQTCQKHCDIGITTDTGTNGIELRSQK